MSTAIIGRDLDRRERPRRRAADLLPAFHDRPSPTLPLLTAAVMTTAIVTCDDQQPRSRQQAEDMMHETELTSECPLCEALQTEIAHFEHFGS